jgi:hypothetical protein
VDAVVRGIATLAPLVEPTLTPEPGGAIASSAGEADDDSAQPVAQADGDDAVSARALVTANDFEAEPQTAVASSSVETEAPEVAAAKPAERSAGASSASEAEPAQDVEQNVAVKPQRGESRKVRPTATAETAPQLQAASVEEPQPATIADEPEAEPTPKPRKKKGG